MDHSVKKAKAKNDNVPQTATDGESAKTCDDDKTLDSNIHTSESLLNVPDEDYDLSMILKRRQKPSEFKQSNKVEKKSVDDGKADYRAMKNKKKREKKKAAKQRKANIGVTSKAADDEKPNSDDDVESLSAPENNGDFFEPSSDEGQGPWVTVDRTKKPKPKPPKPIYDFEHYSDRERTLESEIDEELYCLEIIYEDRYEGPPANIVAETIAKIKKEYQERQNEKKE